MDTIHIYTISNWHLVRYLWPSGSLIGNRYMVYMDCASSEYSNAMVKLRAVSPYLADAIAVWSTGIDEGCMVGFTIHCPMVRSKYRG